MDERPSVLGDVSGRSMHLHWRMRNWQTGSRADCDWTWTISPSV